ISQRSLVLDYLCHNCYTNTARAFARDSTVRHLDADGDEINNKPSDYAGLSAGFLKHVDLREKIRAHILSGRVDDATELLNEYFPSVLSGLIPSPTLSEDKKIPSNMNYIASTSVDPAHLTLNLRILSFIEACRTVPLDYLPASDISKSPQPTTATPEVPTEPLEAQMVLLSKAQKLHALATALPNAADRAIYLKELNNVGGLLAYKVPETSSIAKYLSQERREAVADQINSAILDRSALPSVSSLELLTRYISTIWSFAHQYSVNPRPGALLPPTTSSYAHNTESSTKSSDSEQEVVPPFDLQLFLNLKP
ncbi:CTLH/CRA C-terminal to lish motif domain-containing protein, partial [Collybia nuda]